MRTAITILAFGLAIFVLAKAARAQDDEPTPTKKKKPSTTGKSTTGDGKTKKESASDTKKPSTKSKKTPREPRDRTNHVEPTNEHPDNLLNVHSDRDIELLADELEDLHAAIRKGIENLVGKAKAGKTKAGKELNKDMVAVGLVSAQMQRGRMLSDRLRAAGEPLGSDMALRIAKFHAEYMGYFAQYTSQPAVKQMVTAAYTKVNNDNKAKEKTVLPQVEKLIAAEKWQEADDLLAETLEPLYSLGAYCDQNALPYSKLRSAHETVDKALTEKLQQAVKKAAKEMESAQAPDFAGLLQSAAKAKSEVAAAGKAEFQGESLTGPAVIAQLGSDWRKAQFAAIRGESWSLAYVAAGGADGDPMKFVNEQRSFNAAMCAGLSGIIDADATRAGSDEAESLYPQYVQEIGTLSALSNDSTLEKSATPALTRLAEKSPRLKSDVSAYESATTDLLRWRRRTAAAYVRRHATNYPPLEEHIWQANGGQDGTKLSLARRSQDQARLGNGLQKSTLDVLDLLVPVLIKKKVTVLDLLAPRDERAWSIGASQGFSFARLPARQDYTRAVGHLSADLLVSPTLPPLSLESAEALEGARRGDLEAAGGEVTEIGFHAMIPLLNRIVDEEWGLARLAPLPQFSPELQVRQWVFLRCDLQPAWLQNRYFYLDLSPDQQISAIDP